MASLVLNPKLTKAGFAAMPNQTGTGFAVMLTHIAIGTALYAPTGDEVALKAEAARYPITSGTKPNATSVQTGVTITDSDPNGKSTNNLAIGEIGWFAGNVLVAVWSRVGTPLFVKSPNFDVPFAYTLDISAFPDGSINVTVTTDPQGMAALINQHEAKVEPHAQYVRKERGMGEYDPKTIYAKGAKTTGPDNKSYRSLVDNNVGNAPASNLTKWERWGYSLAEIDTEFVPRRSALQSGTKDYTGMVRVQNPDSAFLGSSGPTGNGLVTGAIKIAFPDGSTAKDSFLRLRVELFEYGGSTGATLLIAGRVTTSNTWENVTVTILGTSTSREFNVRFGNDGVKPNIWIGETGTVWNHPRVYIAELMVSLNADGGNRDFWASGWSMSLVTAFGAVSQVASGNLVFGQSDVSHVAGLQAALNTKFDKSGGDLAGQVRLAEGTVTAPGLSFVNDGNPDTGLWHINDGTFGVTTNGVEVVRFGNGVATYVRRPTFAGAIPWDSANFNKADYLPLAGGGIVSGQLSVNGQLVLQNGAYWQTLRADPSGVVGFVNKAGTNWTLQVYENGLVNLLERPTWKGWTPWDTNNFNPATKQNAGNYMRGADGNDGRYLIGWTGNLQMYVDGTYQGQMWTSANFDPNGKLNKTGRNSGTGGLTIAWSGAGNISGISQNGQSPPLTIANDGNGGASAVIGFLRDGQYGAFFGLDVDNQWAVGGWSMGNTRYRIWHEGNFNPGSYVPIRNGGNASYGYVATNTNNNINIDWTGSYRIHTDGQYQGDLIHSNNFANWCAPRSVMDYGGVGSYTYMNTGANYGVNGLYNLPGVGGTWRCMSGGFGTRGLDYLFVRIG